MKEKRGKLCSSADDFKKYGIEKDKPQVWEDGQRLDEKDFKHGQYEWWYFDAHLDDGSILVSAFIIQVDEKGQVNPQITFNYADKENRIEKTIFFKVGDYKGAKDHCDTNIKENYFRGKGLDEYEMFLDPSCNEGWGFNLKLKREVPSFRPGTGYWDSDGEYFAWFNAVPSGNIEGTLTKAGKEVKVKGNGYHDHNWGNVPMSKILSDWYWGRAEINGLTLVSANVRFKDEAGGRETPLVYITKGEEVILNAINEELSFLSGHKVYHPETKKTYNSDAVYIYEQGNDKVYIRLNGADSIVAYTSVEWENPGWETKYLRFAAQITLDLNMKDNPSINKGLATLEIMDFFGKKK
jgi:hypothetical protein